MAKSYKRMQRTGTVSSISDAISEVSGLAEEMRSWADNMAGTALESTERYSRVTDAADLLENYVDEPSVHEEVAELPIKYSEMVHVNKRKSPSRQVRLANALAIIDAAIDSLNNHLGEIYGTATAEEQEDITYLDDATQLLDDLGNISSALDSVEFPGMFG